MKRNGSEQRTLTVAIFLRYLFWPHEASSCVPIGETGLRSCKPYCRTEVLTLPLDRVIGSTFHSSHHRGHKASFSEIATGRTFAYDGDSHLACLRAPTRERSHACGPNVDDEARVQTVLMHASQLKSIPFWLKADHKKLEYVSLEGEGEGEEEGCILSGMELLGLSAQTTPSAG
ncbi:uncharacterized protein MYCFIDRAFT_170943 [Pseudocercospora fijiensis CIRAD86]|uniref:Uncharacterized protein n=1 Tax=Pseudocercospora fijiensis (strain CIRAD86) TaxID=383855 RepID=N1Q9D4_PSEFD|nr:uncharacterized protein MYCFIDRAFT_170943 [Pseudocercospora fijiensis CIRAD86]EME89484.1 hypothetical protein MYCFIDRAFT_170943 [Pseudocercospora fijiensis CIRAD86]